MKAILKVGEIDWDVGKAPADSEVIGVYAGESAFYDQSRVLHHVRLHSDMIDWLECDLDVAGADDGTSHPDANYFSAPFLDGIDTSCLCISARLS